MPRTPITSYCCIILQYTILYYMISYTLHYITLITLHYITLHYIASHYISLHYIWFTLYCATSHHTTLHSHSCGAGLDFGVFPASLIICFDKLHRVFIDAAGFCGFSLNIIIFASFYFLIWFSGKIQRNEHNKYQYKQHFFNVYMLL